MVVYIIYTSRIASKVSKVINIFGGAMREFHKMTQMQIDEAQRNPFEMEL
jgi:hypothetical protein